MKRLKKLKTKYQVMKKNSLPFNPKLKNQNKKRKNSKTRSIVIKRKFPKQKQGIEELKKEQPLSEASMKNIQKNL